MNLKAQKILSIFFVTDKSLGQIENAVETKTAAAAALPPPGQGEAAVSGSFDDNNAWHSI